MRSAESVLELSGIDKITMPPGIIEKLDNLSLDAKKMLNEEESRNIDISKISMTESYFRWLLNGEFLDNIR